MICLSALKDILIGSAVVGGLSATGYYAYCTWLSQKTENSDKRNNKFDGVTEILRNAVSRASLRNSRISEYSVESSDNGSPIASLEEQQTATKEYTEFESRVEFLRFPGMLPKPLEIPQNFPAEKLVKSVVAVGGAVPKRNTAGKTRTRKPSVIINTEGLPLPTSTY